MPMKRKAVKTKKEPEGMGKRQKSSVTKIQSTSTSQGNSNGPAKPSATYTHWLVKSEPESRLEKGVDVKYDPSEEMRTYVTTPFLSTNSMKSETAINLQFSFEDLKTSPNQTACWDGVRNYQARNFLRDQMKVGHDVFFYHSNCKEPGIIGICKVVRESYPDHTQFDSKDPHYDSSSKTDNPKWFMVDVQYVRPLKRFISLAELKKIYHDHAAKGGPLQNMALFTRARLSVQPLTKEEWSHILKLEDKPQ